MEVLVRHMNSVLEFTMYRSGGTNLKNFRLTIEYSFFYSAFSESYSSEIQAGRGN